FDDDRLACRFGQSSDQYCRIPNQRLGLMCRFSGQRQLNASRTNEVAIMVRLRHCKMVCIYVDAKGTWHTTRHLLDSLRLDTREEAPAFFVPNEPIGNRSADALLNRLAVLSATLNLPA